MKDNKNTVLQFIAPTTVRVVRPTQSGKSVFTKRLIENSQEMFTIPPEKILYAYSEYQKLFDEMEHIRNLTFHEDLPDKQQLEEFSKDKNISCIFISQNLFQPGKYARTISLNCTNFVLFRNPRERQIIQFASRNDTLFYG